LFPDSTLPLRFELACPVDVVFGSSGEKGGASPGWSEVGWAPVVVVVDLITVELVDSTRVVDVVVISPPADTQMEKQGYRILARAYELFSFPYLGLGTHTRKIKDKPDEIRRVIKATIRANRFIRDNRDEAVRALIGWGKVEREFAYASYDALRNLFNADGAVPEDGLKLVIEQARRNAKVIREIMPNEVVDLTFLHEAQVELGIKAR